MPDYPENPTAHNERRGFLLPKHYLIALIIIIPILSVIIFIIINPNSNKASQTVLKYIAPTFVLPTTTPTSPGKVVAQIGEESIFEEDFNYELLFLISLQKDKEVELKKYIFDKIIEDSIILQENKKKVELTKDIYNWPVKDYTKRVDTVKKLKNQIEADLNKNITAKEGYIVSIWYLNMENSPLGYEKSKEIAFNKISSLYTSVKSGQLTIQQAGESVKNDSSLAEIDPAYIVNAISHFRITSAKDICAGCVARMVPDLWSLDLNELTKIYPVKESAVEEYYAFGQVTKVTSGGNNLTYKQWLDKKKSEYKIQIY